MRFALVSDTHANLPAWNAVLDDIESMNVDQIINLGDIVGYGPNPSEVLASVRAHAESSVIGNHDAVCAMRLDSSIFNDHARTVIEWTRDQLDEEAREFLKEVPEVIRPADAGFMATHAEVVAPFDFGYILTETDAAENFAACDDSIIFIGHTHHAGVFVQHESGEVTMHDPGAFHCDPSLRYIINPGSVGDPRSMDITASYCVYDNDTRDIEFRRVTFDIENYRQLLDASGLCAQPFFIRYLDDASTSDPQIDIPPVGITDAMPQINLSLAAPVKKKPKKKSPALIIGILSLIIGAGALTWITMPHSGKTAERTEMPVFEKKELEKTPPKVAVTFPVTARYVRVSNPKGEYLSLAEVEVMSGGENAALRKKATQSSTFGDTMRASKAVDGNRRGDQDHFFTHTDSKRPIWWEVDLGKEYAITSIILWNRTQSPELSLRLDGFTLELYDEQRRLIYLTKDNPGAAERIEMK